MEREQLLKIRETITKEGERLLTDRGRAEAAMVTEMRIDKRLRIRVMNQLLAREPELPNATAWLEKWKKELKAEDETERETEEAEFTAAMNRMGIEVLDEKSKKRRRSKEERERRKREGKCVDCPSDNIRPALPGETRCRGCSENQRERGASYRAKRKKEKGKKGGVRTTSENQRTKVTSREKDEPKGVAPSAGTPRGDEMVEQGARNETSQQKPVLPFLKRGQ